MWGTHAQLSLQETSQKEKPTQRRSFAPMECFVKLFPLKKLHIKEVCMNKNSNRTKCLCSVTLAYRLNSYVSQVSQKWISISVTFGLYRNYIYKEVSVTVFVSRHFLCWEQFDHILGRFGNIKNIFSNFLTKNTNQYVRHEMKQLRSITITIFINTVILAPYGYKNRHFHVNKFLIFQTRLF